MMRIITTIITYDLTIQETILRNEELGRELGRVGKGREERRALLS
jgi:hypothetical protein